MPVNTPSPPVEMPVEVAVTVLISAFSFSIDMVTCGSTEVRQLLGLVRWDCPGLAEFRREGEGQRRLTISTTRGAGRSWDRVAKDKP